MSLRNVFPRLIACAGLCLACSAAHAQSSAAPPTMDTTGYIPIAGNSAAQQTRAIPTAERRDGSAPSVSELQEIHKNDKPKTPPDYSRKKSKIHYTAPRPTPMPMKPPLPQ